MIKVTEMEMTTYCESDQQTWFAYTWVSYKHNLEEVVTKEDFYHKNLQRHQKL
jgi:hypothetical protein